MVVSDSTFNNYLMEKFFKVSKNLSANVDFYSGFVYTMLDIPLEMYTPIFAISRIVGWSAHRIEEIVNNGKIIRPAYKCVSKRRDYTSLDDR
jgi:Citrate synthase